MKFLRYAAGLAVLSVIGCSDLVGPELTPGAYVVVDLPKRQGLVTRGDTTLTTTVVQGEVTILREQENRAYRLNYTVDDSTRVGGQVIGVRTRQMGESGVISSARTSGDELWLMLDNGVEISLWPVRRR
jgi:hypothetical protein